jgi:two-component system, NarL family, invasion response regulator UvrY
MYRVLLVDDHDVVRKGIRAILEDRFAAIDIREASGGDEALDALSAPFDAVVLDLSMPGRSGIDLLAEIKHRHPKLPVLIMSLHGEAQFAVRALRAGAAGYLTKSAASEQLITAFERIVRGGRYISEAVAERLAVAAGGDAGAPHDRLSDREFEVMRGIASGESVSEIAGRIHLSVKTVSTYRARIMEQTGFRSNAEMISYAVRNRLV